MMQVNGREPMRKFLEMITLAALGILISVTVRALVGAESLPARIPTHFDLAGNPNRWGSPTMLLMMPGAAISIYLLLTVVTKSPSAFNYPVRVTVANRLRLQALALDMIAWLKMEMICLFTWIQWATIHAARHPEEGAPASMMPVALVAVFTTITCYIAAMFRVAKEPTGF